MVPQMLHSAYKALFLTNLSEIFKKMISVFEANDEDSKIVLFLYFSSLFLMLITNIIDTSQIAIISHNWQSIPLWNILNQKRRKNKGFIESFQNVQKMYVDKKKLCSFRDSKIVDILQLSRKIPEINLACLTKKFLR